MKKKVLFIYGPLGGGGAERVLIDILRNFDFSRFDVDLTLICKSGILLDEVPAEVNTIGLWKGYTWDYKLALRLSKWLHCNWLFSRKMNGPKLRRDYDLEISFLEGMPLKLGALRTTRAKKATWVHADLFTNHYEADQFYPGEELRDYNRMDYVVNVSKYCEDQFKKRFPECSAELHVIYNPIDRTKIVEMSKASNSNSANNDIINVVTVGRLTPPKNPERLLRVAKIAKENRLPVHFKWVGDGSLRSAMETLRDEIELQDMVEFTGFTKNPFVHIKAADIMMVTSDFEGFCLVICESMCLGVPVISTRTAGPSEIIGNNEYGVLTDKTPEALYSALEKWIKNPENRKEYAIKALNRPEDFSVQKTMNNIYQLIEK